MSGSAAAAAAMSKSASASAVLSAISVATAAICFAVGYLNQMLVGAEPYGEDPRGVTGTHVLYTLDELKAMKSDKERVDAYYNAKADLHDVLEVSTGTRNVRVAYPKLEGRVDLQLLKKAINQFYPDVAADFRFQTPAPAQAAAPIPAAPIPAAPALQTIQMGGGSNSNQRIPGEGGSTGAPRPLFGGGEQPQGYLPGHARIAVGQ